MKRPDSVSAMNFNDSAVSLQVLQVGYEGVRQAKVFKAGVKVTHHQTCQVFEGGEKLKVREKGEASR